MHEHHIIFRSQGGLDFPLNLIDLTLEEHEGDSGPHKNRERDLELKLQLQNELECLFKYSEYYTIDDISKKLHKSKAYFQKHFKRVPMAAAGYLGEDIIRKLMGGKLY